MEPFMRFTARTALRLAAIGVTAAAVLIPVTEAGATVAPSLVVTPSTGLTDGQTVTVTGSNFAVSSSLYVVECSGLSEADCDIADGILGTASTDASGAFSLSFVVHTGTFGTANCDSTSTTCAINATTDPNPSDTAAAATAPISFAAPTVPTITVTPHTGLTNGQSVAVTAADFPASTSYTVIQCSGGAPADCDVADMQSGTTGADGSLSASLTLRTGTVGSGTCATPSTNCFVAVSAGATNVTQEIDFASVSPTGPAITVTPSTNVKNGSTVKVSGSGFPAKAEPLYLIECSSLSGESDCNVGGVVISTTNASGAFSNIGVKVQTGKFGAHSCPAGGKCYIVASTSTSNPPPKADYASTTFTFAKAAPVTATKTTAAAKKGHVTGKVTAAGKGVVGLKAFLEKKVGTKFKKLATLKTGKGGAFSSKKLGKGKYEVVTPKQTHGGHTYGGSHSKVLKI
jgi:hypothetical protein